MRTISKSNLFLQLFLAVSMLCGTALFAQEADTSSQEITPSEEITQGQAAILLVRRLGLWQDSGIVLTQNEAILRLQNLNIAPLGGWDTGEPLNLNELARMLAQALELDSDFSEAEKSDPEAKAHKEALIAQYNLDVDELVQQLDRNRVRIPSALGRILDSTETDPVNKPNPSETDEFIPAAEEQNLLAADVEAVLTAATGVTAPSQDITPSAP